METIPITDLVANEGRLLLAACESGQPFAISLCGDVKAAVTPTSITKKIDWTPGAFRDEIVVHGDLDSEEIWSSLPTHDVA